MKKNVILILTGSFFLFFAGLISCESDDCGPFPDKFKVIGLDWRNYQATYSSDSGIILSEIENDSVQYNHYSIFISPRQLTYFSQITSNRSVKLIQSAYACSPIIPKTDEKIDSIAIVTMKDFDANHLSGSDLSDLFDVVVLDHAYGIYYEKYKLKDYVRTNPFVPSELTLILSEQPELTDDFEFQVKYYQNGENDYFEFSTNKIVILRND
jgi:hypothetical protein